MEERTIMPTGRAAVFAAVCVMLSASAHTIMGHGSAPGWAQAAGFALVFTAARIVAVRERGLVCIGVLMLGAQVGLHLLFDAAVQPVTVHMDAMPAGMPGMIGMTADMPGMVSSTSAMGRLSVGMVLGHVAAAAVVTWWLRRGEAAVFAVAHGVGLRLDGVLRLLFRTFANAVGPVVQVPHIRRADEVFFPVAEVLRFAVVRRGPPRWVS
jgi:hypothetical protein